MGPGNFSISLHTSIKGEKMLYSSKMCYAITLCQYRTYRVFGGNQYIKSENYEEMVVEISFLLNWYVYIRQSAFKPWVYTPLLWRLRVRFKFVQGHPVFIWMHPCHKKPTLARMNPKSNNKIPKSILNQHIKKHYLHQKHLAFFFYQTPIY